MFLGIKCPDGTASRVWALHQSTWSIDVDAINPRVKILLASLNLTRVLQGASVLVY